jgi:hypothetical protein
VMLFLFYNSAIAAVSLLFSTLQKQAEAAETLRTGASDEGPSEGAVDANAMKILDGATAGLVSSSPTNVWWRTDGWHHSGKGQRGVNQLYACRDVIECTMRRMVMCNFVDF